MTMHDTDPVRPGDPDAAPAATADTRDRDRAGTVPGQVLAILGIACLAALAIAIIANQSGGTAFATGMDILKWTAIAGLVLAVIAAFVLSRRRQGGQALHPLRPIIAIVGGLIPAIYGATWLFSWLGSPAIHDISTSLADPPAFAALPVRSDNLDQVPGAGDGDMAGLNPRQRWAAIHQDAYPEIRAVRIDAPMPDVMARAVRIAEARDWAIADGRGQAARLEMQGSATAMALPFQAALRIQPLDGGQASLIDMRLLADAGRSDYGVLSDQLQLFLADLSGTTTATQR